MELKLSIPALATAFVAVAGCFNEPTPAYTEVKPETRVYLKDGKLSVLSVDAVLADGRVFVERARSAEERGKFNGATSTGAWTNLSALVTSFDPATVEYLNLDYNALTNVDALVSFTGLKWLRLNENRLSALPDLSALKGLRRVYLRGNSLKQVPEFLKDLPDLTDVDLSENRAISEIPEWLAKKPGLENLSFSRTSITNLPPDLTAWQSLKSLQLGELRLSPEEMARIRAAFRPDKKPLGTSVVF